MPIKQSAAYTVCCLLLGAVVLFTVLAGQVSRRTARHTWQPAANGPALLIDAGHGGADGGAVGVNGAVEKDINLAVALPLADLLRVCGYPVATTRTQDVSVHTEGSTLRRQKVSDLQHRLAMANEALLTVSLHQNQFPVARYSGAQVFYAPHIADSRRLAETIQAQIVSLLQPQNTRRCKPGGEGIYLLAQAARPTVIVECGFLSNPEECEKLCRPAYQKQMAFAVLTGILQYDP
ncbi:MAG: N-acetylmuramoyl-L-alanine amidase [Clostridia bacterium]|nr:N-acetylmuramoyl-L-alanine amidase [Clostridia bacterium]